MTIPTSDEFVRLVMQSVQSYDRDAFEVYFGVVSETASSGAVVKVKRQGVIGTDADSGYGMLAVARVLGPALAVDDVVLVMRDNKDHYVLGEIGGDEAAPLLLAGNGVETTAATSDHFHISQETSGVYMSMADDAPTDASNASTGTYSTLYSESIALPTGTWTGDQVALGVFKNSVAASGAQMRTSSPTASGSTIVTAPTANSPFTVFDRGSVTGVSGSVTFAAEYRSNVSGTVTPQRWLRIITLRRTA